MLRAYLDAVRLPGQTVNPLLAHLGATVTALDRDGCTIACAATPTLLQGAGLLAGGIIATLLDEAMAHAALMRLEGRQKVATVEMSVRYFAPVKPGEQVAARAWTVRQGSRLLTLEAELLSGAMPGALAAKGVGTFMAL